MCNGPLLTGSGVTDIIQRQPIKQWIMITHLTAKWVLSRERGKSQKAGSLPPHSESLQLLQSVSSPLPQRLAIRFHPENINHNLLLLQRREILCFNCCHGFGNN